MMRRGISDSAHRSYTFLVNREVPDVLIKYTRDFPSYDHAKLFLVGLGVDERTCGSMLESLCPQLVEPGRSWADLLAIALERKFIYVAQQDVFIDKARQYTKEVNYYTLAEFMSAEQALCQSSIECPLFFEDADKAAAYLDAAKIDDSECQEILAIRPEEEMDLPEGSPREQLIHALMAGDIILKELSVLLPHRPKEEEEYEWVEVGQPPPPLPPGQEQLRREREAEAAHARWEQERAREREAMHRRQKAQADALIRASEAGTALCQNCGPGRSPS